MRGFSGFVGFGECLYDLELSFVLSKVHFYRPMGVEFQGVGL